MDQSAPLVGVFQGRDPAHPPQRCLLRVVGVGQHPHRGLRARHHPDQLVGRAAGQHQHPGRVALAQRGGDPVGTRQVADQAPRSRRPGARDGDGGPLDPVAQPVERGREPGSRPEARALERVQRQVDVGTARRPAHRHAAEVGVGERVDHRVHLGPVVAQQRHSAVDQRRQDPAGAELERGGGVEGADAVGEPDGLAHVPHPVLRRAQLLGRGDRAGAVGDHVEPWRAVGET